MAIVKEIEIKVQQAQAISDINKLYKKLTDVDSQNEKVIESAEEIGKTYEETSKEAVSGIDKQSKAMKGLTVVSGGVKKGFDAIGTAFKAMGIGLLVALVAKLTQVLSENQKVVDFVSTVSTAFSIVINDLINKFSDIFAKISEATGGFDALGKVVSGVVNVAFNALKATVLTLQAGFASLKLAYEKVFGDDKGVLKAQKDLDEIGVKLKATANDTAKQAKKIYDNVGEAVGEVVNGVSILAKDGIKAISEVDAKSAYSQAEAITRNKKNFELLALQQERLIQKFENEAELQRQIRDDTSKSIAERIKANTELGKILDEQYKAEQATIQARISGLQQEQNLLGFTQERYNEIYALQTQLLAVTSKITGQRSEQLVNENALIQEQTDLTQSKYDTERELRENQLAFEAEQAETELEKLELEKIALEEKKQADLEELERKRLLYKEDTQNRQDAENEYLLANKEISNQIIANANATAKEEKRIAKEKAEEEKKTAQLVGDAKVAIAGQTLDLLSSLAKEGSDLAKGVAVAQAIIDTYKGATSAYSAMSGIPIVGPALGAVAAGLVVASGLANVKKILSTKPVEKSAGGGGASTPAAPTAPSFNLVQGTGSNQIAESLTTEKQPIQAYVVASNVTSAQELDRNSVSEATV